MKVQRIDGLVYLQERKLHVSCYLSKHFAAAHPGLRKRLTFLSEKQRGAGEAFSPFGVWQIRHNIIPECLQTEKNLSIVESEKFLYNTETYKLKESNGDSIAYAPYH